MSALSPRNAGVAPGSFGVKLDCDGGFYITLDEGFEIMTC